MSDDKSSISGAESYQEMGDFWDSHDLGDFWEQTEAADFEVGISSSKSYFSIEKGLAERLKQMAEQRGVSAQTLLNLWVQEKIEQNI